MRTNKVRKELVCPETLSDELVSSIDVIDVSNRFERVGERAGGAICDQVRHGMPLSRINRDLGCR